jgi:DNA-binding beta-propeller fold protein YncE
LAVLTCVSALACALLAGAGSAAAATTAFGEEGGAAGQFKGPYGVAVNQETGDVFVADQYNWRVDRFDGSGSFSLAWGWHVNEESPAEELQTCTTACEGGKPGTGTGTYAEEGPHGIAVDSNPFSSSHGDVYVTDWENHRVQKFGPQGEFLLMFGWEVNEAGGNVCAVGEHCKAGVEGAKEEGINEDGQFRWAYSGSYIAVGPGGDVYVGDQARVQVFTPAGAWKENIPLSNPEFPGYAKVTALAVDASGDMFLKGEEAPGVRELEPSGTETSTRFDASSGFSIEAVTLDAAGNVYVADTEPAFHVLKYDPTGKEISTFGAGAVGFPRGMAFADATSELYVADAANSDVVVLAAAPSGPLISGEAGTAARVGGATLEGTINPEGRETTYHFEYLTAQQYSEDGDTFGAGTVATSPATLAGTEFEAEQVEAKLPEGTLVPGTTYRWRLVASNECEESRSCTTAGATQTLEELPPALIEGPWAEDVASTSATVAVKIDPLGASTSYRLEYGTSIAYGGVLSGNVGNGEEAVLVSHHFQELVPDTTYHYRLLTSSVIGNVTGGDHSFTTQPPTALQAALPDGRAWELVSPEKTGGAVLGLHETPAITAASDGSGIIYPVLGAPLGEGVESNQPVFSGNVVLSQRGEHAWRTRELALPLVPLPNPGSLPSDGTHYSLFSPDLASSVMEPPAETPPSSLSPEGLEGTPYLRNIATGSFTPLLTAANTPPGTELMVTFHGGRLSGVHAAAGTRDLGHVVLASHLKLTEEAVQKGTPEDSGAGNLYEWSAGRLQLVNRLPGTNKTTEDLVGAELAGESSGQGEVQRAVSDDGRWVAWTRGDPYGSGRGTYKGLYVRDMVEGKTVQLGGHGALYQTMSSDGRRVFFIEGGELYEYDTTTATLTDLTSVHAAGEATAGVQQWVSDVSEDGTYAYFVATGELAEGAVSGADNLYLLHEAAGKWATSYVATLSSEDAPSWHGTTGTGEPHLPTLTSRVSPGGRYLTFMSERSLTGYDNIDANSPPGEPRHDVEVYLYDAATGRLACASCLPSGGRPVGVLSGTNGQLVEGEGGNWSHGAQPHWLGGTLPGWLLANGLDTVSQPRYLSDSGRLFFDSPDALVPQDTNGLEDVYEYEPPGVGGCTSASPTFNARSGGCVALISSGVSKAESGFMDASETGDSVFFLSSDHLSPSDLDGGYDVWDARVCTAAAPCLTAPVSPPPCSSGDSCKPAPAPQPELFGPAPSATFSGAGNGAPAPAVASKPLTRLQKLSRALASCHARYRHSKKRRAACERTAHKHYGYAAKRAHRAKTTKRGGK